MNRKGLLSIIVFMLFAGMALVSPAGAKMLKEVAIGVFDNAPSMAETDRFYMRYHGPEITRLSGPWMSRYQLWLPYEPPEEAVKQFGAVRGRYAELWYTEENYKDRPDLRGITRPPFDTMVNAKKSGQANVMVPANPTDVFLDSDPHPEKTTILRWVTFIRYPEGVSEDEGEKWFKEVYAKEAVKQPGLLKFVSHKVWSPGSAGGSGAQAPQAGGQMPQMMGGSPPQSGGGTPQMSGMPKMRSWVRMCEYWYKDFEAWHKAVLVSPPKYTTPSWGGKFPFVEMTSTFVPYYPDVDFLKGIYTVNYDTPEVTFSTAP